MNKSEIDEALAEKAGVPSINNHLDRRTTCRFFGHAPFSIDDNFKGGKVKFCPYCARILEYWSDDQTGPPETRRERQRKWVKARDNTYHWEYMLSENYNTAYHQEINKKIR